MQTNNVMSWILAHRWAIRPEMLRTMTDIAARGMADGRFRDAASAQVDFQDEGQAKDAIAAKDAQPLQGTRRAEVRNGIAIIKIVGPIFPRANMFTWISGGTSVELLAKDLQAVMTDESVKGLILNIDSPGGEVTGVSELADMVYNARSVKPIVAYGVGDMASAAYWIASATSKIVLSATSEAGCIGVVAGYLDTRERDKKEGVKNIEIVSSLSPGKRPDVLTDAGKAQIQKIVDDMAQVFVAKIARNRGTSRETVIEKYGRGGTIVGQGAVDAGMVDAVGSFEEVLADLAGGKTIFAPFPAARSVTSSELKAENPAVYNSIREEGRLAGLEEGKKAGYDSGHSEGFKSGLEAEAYRVSGVIGLADSFPDDPAVPGIIVRELKKPHVDKGDVAAILVAKHAEDMRGPTQEEIDGSFDSAVAKVNAGRK